MNYIDKKKWKIDTTKNIFGEKSIFKSNIWIIFQFLLQQLHGLYLWLWSNMCFEWNYNIIYCILYGTKKNVSDSHERKFGIQIRTRNAWIISKFTGEMCRVCVIVGVKPHHSLKRILLPNDIQKRDSACEFIINRWLLLCTRLYLPARHKSISDKRQ